MLQSKKARTTRREARLKGRKSDSSVEWMEVEGADEMAELDRMKTLHEAKKEIERLGKDNRELETELTQLQLELESSEANEAFLQSQVEGLLESLTDAGNREAVLREEVKQLNEKIKSLMK
ncbi:hypothetical protein C0995_015408 [Termitomyces sp. Mi166|nr:hypothetical protein C0995_015408 [Termitomyces sp. Mi166\